MTNEQLVGESSWRKIMKFKLTRFAVIKQDNGRSSKAINQPIFAHPATSIKYIQI